MENFISQSALRAKIKILEEGIQSVENWSVNWREHYRSANLGQSWIVMFPWESIIECSGSHLSTALALELLEQYLLDVDTFPESMIDLGIGKGILACSLPLRCFERTGVDFETEVFVDQERTVN